MPKKLKTRRFFAKKFNENKKFSTSKRREIKSRDNSPLPARYQSKHKRYFYVFKKQSCPTHRRTGNRCQTCLPVGLKVIDNSPLPARYQITLHFNGRVCGSRKSRPRSALRLRRRLSALAVYYVQPCGFACQPLRGLVQASVSSLHHD